MNIDELKPGDEHYRAYVGPPLQYDFMGATQFRLLCTLGLRAHHTVLDFGCGSLRAGRLLIPYLEAGHYHGIEPNRWLIDDALENEIGHDLIRIKQPFFDHNDSFNAAVFDKKFDFVIAQSIFSHSGPDLIRVGLKALGEACKPEGLILATFYPGDEDNTRNGWKYPGCVKYTEGKVQEFASEASLFCVQLPWYHPRQTWYALAHESEQIPSRADFQHLTGAVLREPEFQASRNCSQPVSFWHRLSSLFLPNR